MAPIYNSSNHHSENRSRDQSIGDANEDGSNKNGVTDSDRTRLCEAVSVQYAITAEFKLFAHQNLPGIYCIPSALDPRLWFGVLFLRQGLYQGAILRFCLTLPDAFPDTDTSPKITFEMAVFHPDIDPETYELNLKKSIFTWKRYVHRVYHVLIYMQKAFFAIDCTESVNENAARLYRMDMEKFREKVAESVRRSREVVYDPPRSSDPNAIKFTPWDQTVHEPVRAGILKSQKPQASQLSPGGGISSNGGGSSRANGMSFLDDSTFGVLTKENTWTS